MFRHKRALRKKRSGRYAVSKNHKGHSTVDFYCRRLEHAVCNLFQQKSRWKVAFIILLLISVVGLVVTWNYVADNKIEQNAASYSNPVTHSADTDIYGIGYPNNKEDRSILHKSSLNTKTVDLSFIDCNVEIASNTYQQQAKNTNNNNNNNNNNIFDKLWNGFNNDNVTNHHLSKRYATRITTMLNNFDTLPQNDQSMLLNISKYINILNPLNVR